jgi:Terminase large subunit, T4likevirus-type, N-terminal
VSTAQLRREISHLQERRPSRRLAIPEDRLEFAHSLGIVPDSWQGRLLRSEAPRVLLNCARQSGKSTMAAIIALHQALSSPLSLVLILAPAERQAKELFSKVAVAYQTLGHIIPADSYRKMGMELANGSRVEALPGTEKTIRGFSGVDLLLVDEASRVADELYYAVRPMLAVSGGRLMMLSTPYGRRGVFFEEWTGDGAWERYEVPASQCPRISEGFLEEEHQALPRRIYRQEYECSFEETDDQVFSYADVQAAISEEVTPLFGVANG